MRCTVNIIREKAARQMSEKQKIINIAVIAHVDTGKSTLVDALLS